MLKESIAPIETLDYPELDQAEVTADDFCEGFEGICQLERHVLAQTLNVSQHKLNPEYLASHLQTENGQLLIEKIDRILNSDQNAHYINRCLDISGEHVPAYLKDEESRHSTATLAREIIMAGFIQAFLDTKKLSWADKRVYKTREVAANHSLIQLVDGEFGRQAGFTRTHLKSVIRSAYGGPGDKPNKRADMLEAGLAVEVATKRYLESIGEENDMDVRFSSISEDAHGADIVCAMGDKTLTIDTKSSDKNEAHSEDARAFHTRPEEIDLGVFKVRQLYPVNHHSVGDDFGILAQS